MLCTQNDNPNYAVGYPGQLVDVYASPGDIGRSREYYPDIIGIYCLKIIEKSCLHYKWWYLI